MQGKATGFCQAPLLVCISGTSSPSTGARGPYSAVRASQGTSPADSQGSRVTAAVGMRAVRQLMLSWPDVAVEAAQAGADGEGRQLSGQLSRQQSLLSQGDQGLQAVFSKPPAKSAADAAVQCTGDDLSPLGTLSKPHMQASPGKPAPPQSAVGREAGTPLCKAPPRPSHAQQAKRTAAAVRKASVMPACSARKAKAISGSTTPANKARLPAPGSLALPGSESHSSTSSPGSSGSAAQAEAVLALLRMSSSGSLMSPGEVAAGAEAMMETARTAAAGVAAAAKQAAAAVEAAAGGVAGLAHALTTAACSNPFTKPRACLCALLARLSPLRTA